MLLDNFDLMLTKAGQQALWNAKNSGVELDLTHIQIGTSSNNHQNIYESIALDNAVQTVEIAKGDRISDEKIHIASTVIGNGDHLVTEIGIWSGDPSHSDSVLAFYFACGEDDQLALVANEMSVVLNFDLSFVGQDITNINAVIDEDPSLVLSVLNDHLQDDEAHPYYAHKTEDNTFTGENTFTKVIDGTVRRAINVDYTSEADSADNAVSAYKANEAKTAQKLETPRLIHGVEFDASEDIELAVFSSEKSGLVPQTTGEDLFLRSDGVWAKLDVEIGDVESASKLKTARNIGIGGAVISTATAFDGSANITIPALSVDGSFIDGTVPNATKATKANSASSALSAETANTAVRLENERYFSVSGGMTSDKHAFDGSKDLIIEVDSIDGSKIIGSVATAQKLETPRLIGNTYFDASEDIELAVFSAENSGLVPKSNGVSHEVFLCEDGEWKQGRLGGISAEHTWRSITTARKINTNYFNEDPNDFVVISLSQVGSSLLLDLSQDLTNWETLSGQGVGSHLLFIIPPLTYYRLRSLNEFNNTFSSWAELRKWG